MPGSPFYSDGIDMKEAKGLLVEAGLLPEPPCLPLHASLRVQSTNDGKAEKKFWADGGSSLDLVLGTEYRATFLDVRGAVRVVVDPLAQGGRGRIWIRLTRLP